MIIDAHAHLGVTWPDEYTVMTLEESIRMMDLSGIDKACTSASRFLKFDFKEGNRVTAECIRKYPERLIGFFIADPLRSDETVKELDRYINEEGFKGIKIHCSHNSVSYDNNVYDIIYERAARYRLPVLAHAFSYSEAKQLVNAALRFPNVNFICGHSGGKDWSYTIDMIAKTENVYFDVCASVIDSGRVEAFVKAAGAERVMFGTDLPFLKASCCLSQVKHADISNEEKNMILYENISKLLGGVL